MMGKRVILLLASAVAVASCGGSDSFSLSEAEQGWHFQGQHCLGCHNVDLKPSRHLLMAGTVFKSPNVENPKDLSASCKARLFVQLLNEKYEVVYDSRDFYDRNSAGYLGSGNIFILRRLLSDITPYGGYYVRVIDSEGNSLAQSQSLHSFSGIHNYDPRRNPADPLNRFSCNACHRYPDPQGGAPGFIYPQMNANLCK